jgi:hypothetical protein
MLKISKKKILKENYQQKWNIFGNIQYYFIC